jgi:cyclase
VIPLLRETRVRENVWVWTFGGDRIETSYGANCTAVIGRDSVLIVDPFIVPAFARLVENALRQRTSLPVRFVVLTHHHTDHALGASWFAERGATVAAHVACRDAMAAEHPGLIEARRRVRELAELFRDVEPHVPSIVFDDAIEVDLGESRARVFHPGPGHTAGDLVVWLERESVAVCGDLVSVGFHVNYEDAVIGNLESGIRALRDLNARTNVPGHGAPGGPEILEEQLAYHSAIAAASSVEEIRRRFPDYALGEVLPQALASWKKGA